MIDSIQASKKTTLAKFLTAIGIPHVSKQMAEVIASELKTIEKLKGVNKEDLLKIDKIRI